MKLSDDEILECISEHTGELKALAWLKNIRYNQKHTGFGRTIKLLQDAYQNQKAVVIGAGPAFKRFGTHDLAKIRGREEIVKIACLPPSEEVWTERGLIPIEHIVEGDKVLTHRGRFKPVCHVFKRWYEGNLIAVKSVGHYRPTITTPEHPYFTVSKKWGRRRIKDGGDGGCTILSHYSWMESQSLKSASEVSEYQMTAYPIITEENNLKMVAFSYKSRWSNRWLELPITNELMRVIGYYLSEGHLNRKSNGEPQNVCFSFGKGILEFIYASDLTRCLSELGFKPRLWLTGTGLWRVSVCSTLLSRWIEKEFGVKATGKRIPIWVLKLSKNLLKEMFESYINGDGYRYDGGFRASTVSEQLANSLILLGHELGYSSSVSFREGIFHNVILGRNINAKRIYEVCFCTNWGRAKQLDFEVNLIQSGLRSRSEFAYMGYVYNLEVEDDNSYCTSSHCVHNCDGALQTLHEVGVNPDIVCSVDCHPVVANFYRRSRFSKPPMFLLSTTVHRDVVAEIISKYGEEQIFWWQAFSKRDLRKEDRGFDASKLYVPNTPSIYSGGNVGTTCFILASQLLGCKPIGLLGLEFAWSDETPLMELQYYEQIMKLVDGDPERLHKHFKRVKNLRDGKTYIADPVYFTYYLVFRELWRILSPNVRRSTFNLTVQGILSARGLKTIGMSEFIEE